MEDLYEPQAETSKWNREREEAQQRYRLELANQLQLDPEKSRRITSVEAVTGLPGEVVEADLPNLEKRVLAGQFNYDDYLKDSPVWTEFASKNKYHLSVLRESQKEMSGMERALNSISIANDSGWAMTELGNLSTWKLKGNTLTPEQEEEMETYRQLQQGHSFGAPGPISRWLVQVAKTVPTTLYSMREGLDEAALGALTYGTAAMALTAKTGPVGYTPAAMAAKIAAIPSAMLMGGVHGLKAGMGEAAYRLEAGLAYDQFLEMGIPDGEARWAAHSVGGINMVLEVIGFNFMTKHIPGFRQVNGVAARQLVSDAFKRPTMRKAYRDVAARYGESLGGEILTEVAQETTNMVFGEILKANEREKGDLRLQMQKISWSEIKNTWSDIAFKTLQGASLLSAVGPSYNFVMDARRSAKAEETVAKFKALGKYTHDAGVREQAPEKWREWIEHLTERGDVKEIRIDGEGFKTYFQSQNLDPEEVAKSLGVKLPEDGALDQDVVVPMEVYAEYLAATEHHNGLAPDIRVRAGDFTQRDAIKWNKDKDKQIAAIERELKNANANTTDLARIEEDTVSMLIGEYKYNQEAAAVQAKLHALAIVNTARKMNNGVGMDPWVLHQQTLGGVRGEVPESMKGSGVNVEFDSMMDRLRAKEFPTNRQIYGKSLIDFFRDVGGIQDEGGELSGRDFGKAFIGVINKEGKSFDAMAEVAAEAGYIAEADEGLLQEAIDRELSEDQVFSMFSPVNEQLREQRAMMEQTEQFFENEGIDLNQMSNADVKAAIDGIKSFEQSSKSDLMAYTQILGMAISKDIGLYPEVIRAMPRISEDQDFSSVTFADKFVITDPLDSRYGKEGTYTRSAQVDYDEAVNERNTLNRLLDCING